MKSACLFAVFVCGRTALSISPFPRWNPSNSPIRADYNDHPLSRESFDNLLQDTPDRRQQQSYLPPNFAERNQGSNGPPTDQTNHVTNQPVTQPVVGVQLQAAPLPIRPVAVQTNQQPIPSQNLLAATSAVNSNTYGSNARFNNAVFSNYEAPRILTQKKTQTYTPVIATPTFERTVVEGKFMLPTHAAEVDAIAIPSITTLTEAEAVLYKLKHGSRYTPVLKSAALRFIEKYQNKKSKKHHHNHKYADPVYI